MLFLAQSKDKVSETAIQVKKMFEEISNKLVQTGETISSLSQVLTNMRTGISKNIAALNVNIDRLNRYFETIFQLNEIQQAKNTIFNITNAVQDELDKQNVSEIISSLIQGLIKISKEPQELPTEED